MAAHHADSENLWSRESGEAATRWILRYRRARVFPLLPSGDSAPNAQSWKPPPRFRSVITDKLRLGSLCLPQSPGSCCVPGSVLRCRASTIPGVRPRSAGMCTLGTPTFRGALEPNLHTPTHFSLPSTPESTCPVSFPTG